MNTEKQNAEETGSEEQTKIYLLPNLMTAGNLICGFSAILKISEGVLQRKTDSGNWIETITSSLFFILGACIFDLLDGRVARMSGRASSFGREFDSIADIVSFGVAPALLVFNIVLYELDRWGWIVASLYLLCGALRLARFNVLASVNSEKANKEFTGFPIPAAAGLISSITLLMLQINNTKWEDFEQGIGKHFLVVLLVFCSVMMFSKFRYPSFKGFSWRKEHPLPNFIATVGFLALVIMYYKWMLAVVFVIYLFYGFLRPFISRAIRREIEDEEEESGA